MALDTAVYLVTAEIAQRSGLIASRYRVADGRYVLDNKDLSHVRFTTDEYISGLQGVEKVAPDVADTLIAENGYKMGYDGLFGNGNVGTETPSIAVDETEPENQETLETIDESEVGNIEDVLGDLLGGGNQQENEENENKEQNQEDE